MKRRFTDKHSLQTLQLAWPLVITQVGHILTGIVDNMFLGKLGAVEQAAGIVSNNLYTLLLVFTIGVSYASTPLVTAAKEVSDPLKQTSLFKNSLYLNFGVALVCFLFLFFASGLMVHLKQPIEVTTLAIPFFNVLIFSMLPVSFFFTGKQYCEGLSNTRIALVISISGNLINVILNYALIYGKMGLPEMGYMGSAWASFIARSCMGFGFLFYLFRSPLTKEIRAYFFKVKVNLKELNDLARIGFNAGLQFTFEVAAFSIAGLMAGRFGKEHIDAHGIALNLAAFTYMFASGISGAATIRAGKFKAQNNWAEVKKAALAASRLVLTAMGIFGILFLAGASVLPLGFSAEPEIVKLTSQLLVIAAMFQLFDGLQVTMIGILRGLDDVKLPTYVTLVAYWVIAIPLAYLFAFPMGLKTPGIWLALLIALALVAIALSLRLYVLIRRNTFTID
ncbi:MAG: MATE family efflux transporter [Bacteroidia bacterium]|nr:MATE family efflux transporter [Bacteroidia bacterium]